MNKLLLKIISFILLILLGFQVYIWKFSTDLSLSDSDKNAVSRLENKDIDKSLSISSRDFNEKLIKYKPYFEFYFLNNNKIEINNFIKNKDSLTRQSLFKTISENILENDEINNLIVKHLTDKIIDQSLKANFNPLLLSNLIKVQSNFDASYKNENLIGLLALDELNKDVVKDKNSINLLDADQNLEIGLEYLNKVYNLYDNFEAASLHVLKGPEYLFNKIDKSEAIDSKINYKLKSLRSNIEKDIRSFNNNIGQGKINSKKRKIEQEEKAKTLNEVKTYSNFDRAVAVSLEFLKSEYNSKELAKMFYFESAKYALDVNLLLAYSIHITELNNKFDTNLRVGILGFNTERAKQIANKYNMTWGGKNNLFDLKYSLKLFLNYYKEQLTKNKDKNTAIFNTIKFTGKYKDQEVKNILSSLNLLIKTWDQKYLPKPSVKN